MHEAASDGGDEKTVGIGYHGVMRWLGLAGLRSSSIVERIDE